MMGWNEHRIKTFRYRTRRGTLTAANTRLVYEFGTVFVKNYCSQGYQRHFMTGRNHTIRHA